MSSQQKMAPEHRNRFQPKESITEAAVLILLYPKKDEFHIVFMKRPSYPGVHSNQVSLPGGRREAYETDLKQTALRETAEELGIEVSAIEILGQLTPLIIPVSSYKVVPFVGILSNEPSFSPDPEEVKYLLEVSVSDILDPAFIKHEYWDFQDTKVNVPFFNWKGEKVWGATAMILSEFIDILKSQP